MKKDYAPVKVILNEESSIDDAPWYKNAFELDTSLSQEPQKHVTYPIKAS
jgi:hypothetical protein